MCGPAGGSYNAGMATAPRRERGRRPESPRPPHPASRSCLQQAYVEATHPLSRFFGTIDAWLLDNEPELWRRIRAADDELFHLRRLGVAAGRYRVELEAFLARCAEAEQRYYAARPEELRLPPLHAGDRVDVYFTLGDGSVRRAGETE